MSYEQMRSSLSSRLLDHQVPLELLHDILQELDLVAADYDIKRTCMDLIVSGGFPEIVKIYCAALAVENKSLQTIEGYKRELLKFFSTFSKPFNLVTTNDIRTYMFHRQYDDHLMKSSLEHVRVVLNSFFNWLVDEEYMERNPARRIEPLHIDKHGREPIPMIELEQLRLACKSLREKALIDFLYSTAARASECAALSMDDIDWRERSAKIRHGKGDKFRIVYFNAESEVSLRNYLDNRKYESQALFCSRKAPHGHLTKEALELEVRRIRSRVGGLSVQVVPHALRTTFATQASANGMPLEHIQKLMGHANINTTMRYVHSAQEDARASHRKYVT